VSRVGVIGAGQLARMMQIPAIELGIELRVFAQEPDESAALTTTKIGNYRDFDQLLEFANSVDVVTFDHEHVPIAVLKQLVSLGHDVRPGPEALIHAQNKLTMRRKLQELGLPQPIWSAANSVEEIESFIAAHGPKVVIKTPIGGYDGRGVRVISSAAEVSDWLDAITEVGGALLLEQKVEFVRELAQLSARRPNGEFVSWSTVETRQSNGVCSEVISPAPGANFEAVKEIAQVISENLGVVGVMAVELFELPSGQVLVNELAMRPHNSGHFSIEGSNTSQFEQHLRAVLDLPLGSTSPLSEAAVMVNLLGVDSDNDLVSRFPRAMSEFPEVKIHTYQKAPRMGRKMGHITVIGDNAERLLERARGASQVLFGPSA
jgi:5-(carboxyamino)imidazole ribonucleotide synthase